MLIEVIESNSDIKTFISPKCKIRKYTTGGLDEVLIIFEDKYSTEIKLTVNKEEVQRLKKLLIEV